MSQRPLRITLLCCVMLLALIGSAYNISSGKIDFTLPNWYYSYLTISLSLNFLALIGLWLMRKWGLILYLVVFLCSQVSAYNAEIWQPASAIIPLLFLFYLSSAYHLMR